MLAVLVACLGVSAVAALACEGTGGPPSAPPEKEQKCNATSPNLELACVGKPVNNATGDETEEQTDTFIAGRGPGLALKRSYDSFAAAEGKEGPLGIGWSMPYGAKLEVSGETTLIRQADGSVIEFFKSGTGYTQGGWDQARLTKSTNYTLTLPDQSKEEFNTEGRLVKETDRDGNANTLAYASGKLETVTDGAGRKLTFKYNGEGFVESVKDPMGHVASYTYSSKQLASVTIEGKERWKFEYESPHLLTKLTDGRGHVTTIKYEATTHRATEQTRAGHTRKWEYKTKETKITEPNGSETLETFNSAGEPTKITRAKGVAGVETTTEYEYSGTTFARTKMLDGLKHETTYGYDEEGNKTSEKGPAGDERKWKYDAKHDVESETTPEGETTTIKLTGSGKPEVVERPVGEETQKTKYKYAENGDLSEVTDPLGNVTKYTYDEYGDRASEKDAEGDERKYKYNEDGQLTEETSPRGFATKYELDEQGRRKKITDPLGHTTKYLYDGDGNAESETDGNEHTTKTTYNEEDLPTKVEEPNKTIVETGYDSEGQKTSFTDGNKHVWEYKRDQLEQVTEEKTPLGRLTKKKYDKAGNLESLEDPEKHTAEYGYDNANRLTKVKYSTGKPSEVKYEYNKDSKVTKMTDETGETKNTWDKLDRLTEAKNGAGKVVKYEYDLAGETTKITYPNEKAVTRSYDKALRLEKVKDWNSKEIGFKYNKDGQAEKTTFPGTENEDSYAYDEADELTEIHYKHEAATLAGLVYTRDNDGQVKKATQTGLPGAETTEAKYDENNRVTEGQGKTYEYDAANNPTKIDSTAGYTYNEADQLEKGAGNTYTYDEDGQRTKTKPETGPTTTYSYDQAGNLTGVERPEEGLIPKIEDAYKYDGANLRQTQTINGTTTHLTWDTAEPLPLLLTDDTNSYVYGPEGVPVEQISSGGATLYLHHDQQASTRLLTNTAGATETTYTYTAYGATLATSGTATTPLRYDGQYASTDTGLIYLRARSYDPITAQFLTSDPALPATGEPYAYGQDDPETLSDYTGTCSNAIEKAGICASLTAARAGYFALKQAAGWLAYRSYLEVLGARAVLANQGRNAAGRAKYGAEVIAYEALMRAFERVESLLSKREVEIQNERFKYGCAGFPISGRLSPPVTQGGWFWWLQPLLTWSVGSLRG
ncbi:MAG TPA: RHS repeat-associated core domain-containing protein [Solirubrobacteraceae bacterium]|nr:RHS repeat-associated core domain-containing protein [Solirubrobacteraceae bacterium]